MLVLGIETSCDETGLGLVADGQKVLATQLGTSLPAHQRYGGIVPEIASRAHVELMVYELEALLKAGKVSPRAVDRIAVTHGPGLPGALLVGVAAAKALRIAWRRELVGVNHLQAHLYAAFMTPPPGLSPAGLSDIGSDLPLAKKQVAEGVVSAKGRKAGGGVTSACWPLDLPMVGLVISGGHTALVELDGIRRARILGQTRDDAVGEAFDKVAKLLGLGFPGGPEIERVARTGNPKAFRFSVPKIKSGSAYDFSLSGIKTAVLYKVQGEMRSRGQALSYSGKFLSGTKVPDPFVADMAASFQSAVVQEVADKTLAACRDTGIERLVVGGGVVANRSLREQLKDRCADAKIDIGIPALNLCTDNGAMVAGLGAHLRPTSLKQLTAVPDLGMEMSE